MTRTALAALLLLAVAACSRARPSTAPSPAPAAPATESDVEYLRGRLLMVPVAGIAPERVPDTYQAARGGDRVHRALDILAPRGTPVVAADDGRVYKLRSNTLGGLTIYAVDTAERFIYYYAHLDAYRDGLREGMPLRQGDLLGFVGTSGNAPANTPHLHFQVMRMRPDRYWDGAPLNPLPFLSFSGLVRRSTVDSTSVSR
ncbi:MAG TPA: M23 family metallopeptidase [Gemmatimonadaceae bacterium]|nr:M23 family metallopeptidase [Gemmatimonadaceae bacterium]